LRVPVLNFLFQSLRSSSVDALFKVRKMLVQENNEYFDR
jgi:hypothetical protein